MSKLALWAAGKPLAFYAPYGDLTATFAWGPDVVGGLQSVEWTQPALAGAQIVPPEYVAGTQLELRDSGIVIGQCILSTPDFNEGSFTAWGIAQAPSKLTPNAMDDDYAPVYNLHDAVVYAIGRGKLPGWRDPGDLSTTDLRTLTDGNQLDDSTGYNVSDLITTYCRTTSATTRAFIDEAGFLRFREDATTANIALRDVEPFMLTSDNYVDTLVTDYQTFTVDPDTGAFVRGRVASTRATPSGLSGVERGLDITNQGSLTEMQAQASSDAALARLLPEYDRSGSRDVIQRQVTDIYGTEIPFTMIPLGSLVKHPGARIAGGSIIPGLADEWVLGSMVIESKQGRITGATLAPLTSNTNPLQLVYSTAVQAQIAAIQSGALATSAIGAAGVAQTSADGKSVITYTSYSGGAYQVPTSSSSGSAGDTWFVLSDGTHSLGGRPVYAAGTVLAHYSCSGGTGPSSYVWANQGLVALTVDSLDAGRITAGTISVALLLLAAKMATATSGGRVEIGTTGAGGVSYARWFDASGNSAWIQMDTGSMVIFNQAHANEVALDANGDIGLYPASGRYVNVGSGNRFIVGTTGEPGANGIAAAGNINAVGSLQALGDVNYYGDIHDLSSERLKVDVEPLDLDPDALLELGAYQFRYADFAIYDPDGVGAAEADGLGVPVDPDATAGEDGVILPPLKVGRIAEEVFARAPYAVQIDSDGKPIAIKRGVMIDLLVAGYQKQSAQIADLQRQLSTLSS